MTEKQIYDFAIELAPDLSYNKIAKTLPPGADLFKTIGLAVFGFDLESNNFGLDYISQLKKYEEQRRKIHMKYSQMSGDLGEEEDEDEFETDLQDSYNLFNFHTEDDLIEEEEEEGLHDMMDLEEDEEVEYKGVDANEPPKTMNKKENIFNSINRKDFMARLSILRNKRAYFEREKRRSTLNFNSVYASNLPDTEALKNFYYCLSSGIIVTKHQAKENPIRIKLRLDPDNFDYICWETIQDNNTNKKKLKSDKESIASLSYSEFESSGFECLFKLCSCGESKKSNDGLCSIENSIKKCNICHSIKDKTQPTSGRFCITDVFSIIRGNEDDPTTPGQFATYNIRHSNMPPVVDHAFSLILIHNEKFGYITFDLECDSLKDYYILYCGFRLKLKELKNKQKKHIELEKNYLPSWLNNCFPNNKDQAAPKDLFSSTNKVEILRFCWMCNWRGLNVNCNLPYRFIDYFKVILKSIDYCWKDCIGRDRSTSYSSDIEMNKMNSHHSESTYQDDDAFDFLGEEVESNNNSDDDDEEEINNYNDKEDGYNNQFDSSLTPSLLKKETFANIPGIHIWLKLILQGFIVRPVFSWDLNRIILKIKCPSWRLEMTAEMLKMKLLTKDNQLEPFKIKKRNIFHRYSLSTNRPLEQDDYVNIKKVKTSSLFRSSDRLYIINYLLKSNFSGCSLDSYFRTSGSRYQSFFNSTPKIGENIMDMKEPETEENDQDKFDITKHIVQIFPLHHYAQLEELTHSWVTFWKQEEYGKLPESWSIFSSPYSKSFKNITNSTIFFINRLLYQPLDNIALYFGESIAFYFAFLGYYTQFLIFPSLLGLIVFIVQMRTGKFDHWLCAPYALVIMIWISLLLAYWNQYSSTLAYRWGVLDYEHEETPRPQYFGDKRRLYSEDEVYKKKVENAKYHNNEDETELERLNSTFTSSLSKDDEATDVIVYFPFWKRALRYCVTIPIIIALIFGSLVIIAITFNTQNRLIEEYYNNEEINLYPSVPFLSKKNNYSNHQNSTSFNYSPLDLKDYNIYKFNETFESNTEMIDSHFSVSDLLDPDYLKATFLYPCAYGIISSLLSKFFSMLAVRLNDYENHRTNSVYMNRLILKIFSFQFVSVFTSLYYFAFFTDDIEYAFSRISITIFSLMTVGQWWSLILDVFFPHLFHKLLLTHLKYNITNINRDIYYHINLLNSSYIKNNPEDNKKLYNISNRMFYRDQAINSCWLESVQKTYETYSDYTSLIIQICFILFFSTIFPLAPLIALINNLFIIRINAFKICRTRQRPIAYKASGIYIWSDILQILSVAGALMNCILLGYISNTFKSVLEPSIGMSGISLLLFGCEQILLLFKYWLHQSIPSIDPTIAKLKLKKSYRSSTNLDQTQYQNHRYHHQSYNSDDRDYDREYDFDDDREEQDDNEENNRENYSYNNNYYDNLDDLYAPPPDEEELPPPSEEDDDEEVPPPSEEVNDEEKDENSPLINKFNENRSPLLDPKYPSSIDFYHSLVNRKKNGKKVSPLKNENEFWNFGTPDTTPVRQEIMIRDDEENKYSNIDNSFNINEPNNKKNKQNWFVKNFNKVLGNTPSKNSLDLLPLGSPRGNNKNEFKNDQNNDQYNDKKNNVKNNKKSKKNEDLNRTLPDITDPNVLILSPNHSAHVSVKKAKPQYITPSSSSSSINNYYHDNMRNIEHENNTFLKIKEKVAEFLQNQGINQPQEVLEQEFEEVEVDEESEEEIEEEEIEEEEIEEEEIEEEEIEEEEIEEEEIEKEEIAEKNKESQSLSHIEINSISSIEDSNKKIDVNINKKQENDSNISLNSNIDEKIKKIEKNIKQNKTNLNNNNKIIAKKQVNSIPPSSSSSSTSIKSSISNKKIYQTPDKKIISIKNSSIPNPSNGLPRPRRVNTKPRVPTQQELDYKPPQNKNIIKKKVIKTEKKKNIEENNEDLYREPPSFIPTVNPYNEFIKPKLRRKDEFSSIDNVYDIDTQLKHKSSNSSYQSNQPNYPYYPQNNPYLPSNPSYNPYNPYNPYNQIQNPYLNNQYNNQRNKKDINPYIINQRQESSSSELSNYPNLIRNNSYNNQIKKPSQRKIEKINNPFDFY